MEKEYLRTAVPQGHIIAESLIIYADPMDLTKMLNIEPGDTAARWGSRYAGAVLSLVREEF